MKQLIINILGLILAASIVTIVAGLAVFIVHDVLVITNLIV
jgi:hypothetical protein